jgi:hypothetical protein
MMGGRVVGWPGREQDGRLVEDGVGWRGRWRFPEPLARRGVRGGFVGILREFQNIQEKTVTFWRLMCTKYMDNCAFFRKKEAEEEGILRVSVWVILAGE